jgi:hypothetical protein
MRGRELVAATTAVFLAGCAPGAPAPTREQTRLANLFGAAPRSVLEPTRRILRLTKAPPGSEITGLASTAESLDITSGTKGQLPLGDIRRVTPDGDDANDKTLDCTTVRVEGGVSYVEALDTSGGSPTDAVTGVFEAGKDGVPRLVFCPTTAESAKHTILLRGVSSFPATPQPTPTS